MREPCVLRLLRRTAPIWWIITGWLVVEHSIWHDFLRNSGLTVFIAALAITGTTLWGIRHYTLTSPASALLDRLLDEREMASQAMPDDGGTPRLRAVRPGGQSGSPAAHQSAS